MPTLTPQSRNQEATNEAMQEGLISGVFVLLPSLGCLYVAMQNETFLKRTNWQSRTAMVIMPALFVFSLTAETYLRHKMTEIAQETQHHTDTVRWAEQQHRQEFPLHQQQQQQNNNNENRSKKELHLTTLYKESIEKSGVNIVPGDKLQLHHRLANFVAANPIKVLAGLALPSVALIFYGKTGKEHLQMSTKLLHTRVFGQFTTISLLLGIMGFKDYMDQHGRFITEAEADRRVEEMQQIRERLMERLEYEQQAKEQLQRELAQAHEIVEQSKVTTNSPPKLKKNKKKKKQTTDNSASLTNDDDATNTVSSTTPS